MKAASNKPLRVDCLARELPNRIALVASSFDPPDLALQIVRDLHEVLESGDYELRFRQAAEAKRRKPPFVGRPMTSKLERSTCDVCKGPINAGDSIIYNRELRRAAHQSCGEVDE